MSLSTEPSNQVAGGPAGNGKIPAPRTGAGSVGGPVPVAWREGTLTRAKELESLSLWLGKPDGEPRAPDDLLQAIAEHLQAARDAAEHGKRRFWRPMDASLLERAISNLDAAQADLLQVAPPEYILGQLPSLLNQVQRHLPPNDPRRQQFDFTAARLGVHGPGNPAKPGDSVPTPEDRREIVEAERNTIVSIVRGASSAGLREQLRVRSFRTVLAIAAFVMTLLAAAVALLGWISPAALPLCFQPEKSGEVVVVCPTGQSRAVRTNGSAPLQDSVDVLLKQAVGQADLLVVELVGLLAAAVAGAAAIRGIRGSSEPHGLPVALALLKLPTGAVTAVLGLLLMRGEFIPGLSALDTPGQIIAWAVVFGYAQQLFTRFVDQQANSVLSDVRGSRTAPGQANG